MSGDQTSAVEDGGSAEAEEEPTDAVSAALPGFLAREHLVRAGHVVAVVLLVAAVIPFVLYVVPQLIGAEYSYVVTSGSMAPTLQAYDVVFVDAVEPDAVREGDIINFDRPGDERTTTHRVIGVVESGDQPAFRTAGDNNDKPDNEIVTAEQLRGRVMHAGGTAVTIPHVGRVIGFASGQFGFVLLFVVPVSLLIANEVYNFVATSDGEEPASSTDGTDAGSGPEPGGAVTGTVEPPSAPVEPESDGVSFSPAELKLGTAILGAFLVYSGWMAISDPDAVTVGVAGSVTVALVMLGGLYWRGTTETRSGGPRQSLPESTDEGVVIRTAPIDPRSAADNRSVDSLETLIETSEAIGRALYRTPDGGTYYLSTGSRTYVYGAGAATRDSTAAAEARPSRSSPDEGDGSAADDSGAGAGENGEAVSDAGGVDIGGDDTEGVDAAGDPADGGDSGREGLAGEEADLLPDDPIPVGGSDDDVAEATDEQPGETGGQPVDRESGVDTADGAEDDSSATINADPNLEADDD